MDPKDKVQQIRPFSKVDKTMSKIWQVDKMEG